jgi:ribosomal-protein-alanine N-acetyltransferase
MHLNRIEADVVAGNDASMHILNKLGFRQEGVWRERIFKNGQFHDVVQFGLLRRDLQS